MYNLKPPRAQLLFSLESIPLYQVYRLYARTYQPQAGFFKKYSFPPLHPTVVLLQIY